VIASLNAWRGDPNLTTYAASKHAVLGIVRSAALDLGRHGVRVNAVAPGPVATDALLRRLDRRARGGGALVHEALQAASAATALGRIATADDVAGAALFLASDLAAGVSGHLLPVDGGLP
jgi:NAD(P)-dependent dehydrogenase (short-subunit alcohol dehydrogenase family)